MEECAIYTIVKFVCTDRYRILYDRYYNRYIINRYTIVYLQMGHFQYLVKKTYEIKILDIPKKEGILKVPRAKTPILLDADGAARPFEFSEG